MRIGQGYDVHRYRPGSGIRLGGVDIQCEYEVVAHSDGDVLLHACCDAILGALGLGDIGRHFPDSDVRFKDCNSRELLTAVYNMLYDRGMRVINLDATVVAQTPRLSSYISAMRECIAADLKVENGAINVKATTTERLGFTGREEGIAAMAVVLIDQTQR